MPGTGGGKARAAFGGGLHVDGRHNAWGIRSGSRKAAAVSPGPVLTWAAWAAALGQV
jgi:hypothetical protein